MTEHTLLIRHKIGEETGLLLQQATCTCGWKAGIWYVSGKLLDESYGRHIDAIEQGSDVPWMVAPIAQGGAA